jgi:hypothetical protein
VALDFGFGFDVMRIGISKIEAFYHGAKAAQVSQ